MRNDRTTHILARLEIGFRTDGARLKELEKDLAAALERARHFGTQHGSPDVWNTNWQQEWANVENILYRIRALLNEMEGCIESRDRDQLNQALEAWKTIQAEDARLVEALSAMRKHAIGLNTAVRKDWNLLAGTLESHFETIHAYAQALRIRLELLKAHSREEVDQLVQDILSKLPNRAHAEETDTSSHDQVYRQAAAELEQEHHQFLGFVDVVKSLFLWVETAEERARKNLSLEVEQA